MDEAALRWRMGVRGRDGVISRVDNNQKEGIVSTRGHHLSGPVQALLEYFRVVEIRSSTHQQGDAEPASQIVGQLKERVPRSMSVGVGIKVSAAAVAIEDDNNGAVRQKTFYFL